MRIASLGVVSVVALTLSCHGAFAQFGGVVTAVAARGIIGQAQEAVDDGFDRAKTTGSALIAQSASAASILIQTLTMELGGSLADLKRDLRPEEITLLGKITSITDQLQGAQAAAYDFKDSAVIDLAGLEAVLPFVHLPYFIQRIKGLSQVVSDGGDYPMTLSAFGLTPGSSNTASAVRVLDDATGTEIPSRVNITANGQAQITLLNAGLKPYFQPAKVVVLPVDVEMTVVQHRRILPDRHYKIVAKVGLSLFPTKAGQVTVTAYRPTYVWKKLKSEDSTHVASGDGEDGHSVIQDLKLPGSGEASPHVGNLIYANPHQHCVMKVNTPTLPPCNATDGNQNGWFEIIRYPAISESGTRLTWEGKGYHQPKFLWVTYDLMEYQAGPEEVIKKDYDLKWGESIDFALPDGMTRYRIDGQSITFQTISLSTGKASSLLQFDEQTPFPNSVAVYHVSPPPS